MAEISQHYTIVAIYHLNTVNLHFARLVAFRFIPPIRSCPMICPPSQLVGRSPSPLPGQSSGCSSLSPPGYSLPLPTSKPSWNMCICKLGLATTFLALNPPNENIYSTYIANAIFSDFLTSSLPFLVDVSAARKRIRVAKSYQNLWAVSRKVKLHVVLLPILAIRS